MKTIVAIATVALLISLTVGCTDNSEAIKHAQMEMKTQHFESMQRLQDEDHDLMVQAARLDEGEGTAASLDECYRDGYQRVIDEQPNGEIRWTNRSELGPKYVAKCSRIESRIRKRLDATEKQHKAESSR